MLCYSHNSARKVCVDGSDMRGGDGVFINSSCSPNAMLHPCYIFHDEDVYLPDSSGNIQSARLRNIILVFRPLRYVFQPFSLTLHSHS